MLIVHSLSLGIVMVINILEIMVAFVQAGVFVILMSVYTNDVLEAGH
jgi:F0F1-type ATP synthase membrane subunit a|tara:strand:+ start:1825 stop:1965 length:141 start_codon:yes stop_codon:yes gene_type:complete